MVLVLDASEAMASNDPSNLRKSATAAFVNGLGAQARAAVVEFDDDGQVVQALTSDKGALITVINDINDSGGSDLGAGIRAALTELSGASDPDRDQAIVLMTDGEASYDTSLTAEAAAAGVRVFTIGLGSSVDSTLLTSLAEATGGTYSHAVPLVGPPNVDEEKVTVGPDTDGDGLSDCEEKQGAWDERGAHHVTDAHKPDTDGDGLTDGQEVTNDLDSFGAAAASGLLHLALGIEGFRYVVSDPNTPDSDGDGATDPLEFDVGTQPFGSDSDGDGLDDYAEVGDYGTNPLERNTDGDQRDDGWELDNASAGFDPIIYDEELSKLSYAKDFAAGTTCPDGWGWCETDTVAFLAGSIGAGFFGYKDVLDFLGNLTALDFVGAGLAATALVPVAGDAGSFVTKGVRFLKRVPARKQIDGLAHLARADSIPASARMKVLGLVDGDSLSVLKGAGMTDEGILALVRRRIDFRVLTRSVRGASKVEKSPRLFPSERDAQNYLAAKTSGAVLEKSFPCPGCASNSVLGSRRVDIYDPTSKTAVEVKNGYVLSATTRDEVAKDVALINDPATPIDSVVWHFFPKHDGRVGPDDELRDLLTSSGIPYVIHLP